MSGNRVRKQKTRDFNSKQMWGILAVAALSIGAFFLFRAPRAPSEPVQEIEKDFIWFDELRGVERLSREQEQETAEWVFSRLFNDQSAAQPDLSFADDQPRMLFLSLSDGAAKARVIRQSGRSLPEAAEGLLSQVESLAAAGFIPVWAKLDFVTDIAFDPAFDLAAPSALERSLNGLAFAVDSDIALLPEELLANTLFDSGQVFRPENLITYFEESGQPVDYAQGFSAMQKTPAYRFATSAYFYENGQALTLYRGHRVFPVYTSADLLQSAIAGGDYLVSAVDENGRFIYSYLPKSDSEKDDYNILRHAGTTYAMLDLYSDTGDEELLAAAERAIHYLMTQVRLCPVGAGFENCLVEDERAKLGGNGLAVLALSYYMRITGNEALLEDTQSMARWMLSIQAESGEFVTHIVEYTTGEESDSISEYYPGEAVYALANLYLVDGDENWLRAAQVGARWLADDRIQDKAPEEITHDHWLLLGLDTIQHISPDPVFFESSMTIADAIIRAQNLTPEYPDWFGSYYKPPRSTPTATRSEGLMAAYRVARDFGTAGEAEHILQAVKNNISFQLGTQFHPETAMYVADPQRVLGGFHRDLTNFEIRNDYVQHNISAILALHRALTE